MPLFPGEEVEASVQITKREAHGLEMVELGGTQDLPPPFSGQETLQEPRALPVVCVGAVGDKNFVTSTSALSAV